MRRHLTAELAHEQEKNVELYKQLLQSRRKSNRLKRSRGFKRIFPDAAFPASACGALAGLTSVEGGGVQVTLSDSTQTNNLTENANAYVIHDLDILQVINELRDAGAEAISLNGERVVSTSEVRYAGSTVSINNNRYAAPFVIKAIGDPTNLGKRPF